MNVILKKCCHTTTYSSLGKGKQPPTAVPANPAYLCVTVPAVCPGSAAFPSWLLGELILKKLEIAVPGYQTFMENICGFLSKTTRHMESAQVHSHLSPALI